MSHCHTVFECTAMTFHGASSCTYARPLTCKSCVFFMASSLLIIVGDFFGARIVHHQWVLTAPSKVQLWLVAVDVVFDTTRSLQRFEILDSSSRRGFSPWVFQIVFGHGSAGFGAQQQYDQKLRRFFMLRGDLIRCTILIVLSLLPCPVLLVKPIPACPIQKIASHWLRKHLYGGALQSNYKKSEEQMNRGGRCQAA